MNVFSLFENAALAFKHKPAVRYGDLRQTYGELSDLASAFVSRLASLGLHRGDRVAIFMRNGFLYPSALLGAFRGGCQAPSWKGLIDSWCKGRPGGGLPMIRWPAGALR